MTTVGFGTGAIMASPLTASDGAPLRKADLVVRADSFRLIESESGKQLDLVKGVFPAV